MNTNLSTDGKQYSDKVKKLLFDTYKKQTENKVPIYKGCKNKECFCTGDCQEIIGWADKTPGQEEEMFN